MSERIRSQTAFSTTKDTKSLGYWINLPFVLFVVNYPPNSLTTKFTKTTKLPIASEVIVSALLVIDK